MEHLLNLNENWQAIETEIFVNELITDFGLNLVHCGRVDKFEWQISVQENNELSSLSSKLVHFTNKFFSLSTISTMIDYQSLAVTMNAMH